MLITKTKNDRESDNKSMQTRKMCLAMFYNDVL